MNLKRVYILIYVSILIGTTKNLCFQSVTDLINWYRYLLSHYTKVNRGRSTMRWIIGKHLIDFTLVKPLCILYWPTCSKFHIIWLDGLKIVLILWSVNGMGGDFLENRYKCDGKISHCDVPTASACRVPMAKPVQVLTSGIKVLARARCYTEVNTSPYKQDNSETYSEAPIVAKKNNICLSIPIWNKT